MGAEPPIDVKGDKRAPETVRRGSVRWLIGAGLTGLMGAGLFGGAIYAAFDRETHFAQAPTRALLGRKEQAEGSAVNPLKGDRLVKAVDIIAAKQTFKAPTTIRVGDHEMVRTRTFTKVATTLTLTDTGLSADVPEFNPLRLLAESSNTATEAPETAPAPDDAEVSFTSSDLGPTAFGASGDQLSLDEVRAQVAETVKAAQARGAGAPLPLPAQMLLMRTSRVGLDVGPGLSYAAPMLGGASSPFSSIEVRMVPENVTLAPRAATETGDGGEGNAKEQLLMARRGEGLEEVLADAHVAKDVAAAVKEAFHSARIGDPVGEGKRVKLSFSESEAGDDLQLSRLAVYDDEKLKAAVALADDGRYRLMENTQPSETKAKRPDADEDSEDQDDAGGMRLYNSLYETSLKQNIPRPIIDQLVRSFGNDVDFQRPVAAGDSIEAFYDNGEEADASRGDLLYASITTHGETYHYYRFLTPDDQTVDYYNQLGQSTRKFLLRKPIASGELRSTFGMRYHPILHYSRPHNGVDWAAPVGTPIFAAGNGVVIKAAWTSGYGRRVEVEHNNGYVTTYNHMSAFARGLKEGQRIKQGQMVGYLGSSGLSTGPHLHYEVIVNGRFVDPLRVKLAKTRQFEGRQLAEFKRERDRIDGLMAKAPSAQIAGK